jgi:hypothetical protein
MAVELASEFADVILIPILGAVGLVDLDISGHRNQISGVTGYVISYQVQPWKRVRGSDE